MVQVLSPNIQNEKMLKIYDLSNLLEMLLDFNFGEDSTKDDHDESLGTFR